MSALRINQHLQKICFRAWKMIRSSRNGLFKVHPSRTLSSKVSNCASGWASRTEKSASTNSCSDEGLINENAKGRWKEQLLRNVWSTQMQRVDGRKSFNAEPRHCPAHISTLYQSQFGWDYVPRDYVPLSPFKQGFQATPWAG
jgi:hypothetical protein